MQPHAVKRGACDVHPWRSSVRFVIDGRTWHHGPVFRPFGPVGGPAAVVEADRAAEDVLEHPAGQVALIERRRLSFDVDFDRQRVRAEPLLAAQFQATEPAEADLQLVVLQPDRLDLADLMPEGISLQLDDSTQVKGQSLLRKFHMTSLSVHVPRFLRGEGW